LEGLLEDLYKRGGVPIPERPAKGQATLLAQIAAKEAELAKLRETVK